MKRPYQVTGIVLVLVAVFLVRESLKLKFYTQLGPGPGFFPMLITILLGFLGMVMLVQATFRDSDPMPADFFATPSGYFRIGAILLSYAAVVVLMIPLGFRLTSLGFLAFLLLSLGRQNLLVTAAVALVGSLGTYHVFVNWLSTPLPIGMFGF